MTSVILWKRPNRKMNRYRRVILREFGQFFLVSWLTDTPWSCYSEFSNLTVKCVCFFFLLNIAPWSDALVKFSWSCFHEFASHRQCVAGFMGKRHQQGFRQVFLSFPGQQAHVHRLLFWVSSLESLSWPGFLEFPYYTDTPWPGFADFPWPRGKVAYVPHTKRHHARLWSNFYGVVVIWLKLSTKREV